MTDSFKSTAATNIYDQAVNTYFNPVSVLPETGIMGIARALKNNNPDLQRYLGNVIEEEKQKGVLYLDPLLGRVHDSSHLLDYFHYC